MEYSGESREMTTENNMTEEEFTAIEQRFARLLNTTVAQLIIRQNIWLNINMALRGIQEGHA